MENNEFRYVKAKKAHPPAILPPRSHDDKVLESPKTAGIHRVLRCLEHQF
jgi:hypothetical protein